MRHVLRDNERRERREAEDRQAARDALHAPLRNTRCSRDIHGNLNCVSF
jgi:hypothetical protein